jgi:hypothetical protein
VKNVPALTVHSDHHTVSLEVPPLGADQFDVVVVMDKAPAKEDYRLGTDQVSAQPFRAGEYYEKEAVNLQRFRIMEAVTLLVDIFRVRVQIKKKHYLKIKEALTLISYLKPIGGTGFEPVTSSVSRKRSTPEPTACTARIL